MAGRDIKEYVGLSRDVATNKIYTAVSGHGDMISFQNQFKGLLEEAVLKWALTDGSTPAPYPYKTNDEESSIYYIDGPAKIALAADWASDTVQSAKIAELMRQKDADYTIHLGDTYYSGSKDEIAANFINGPWPKGSKGTFAVLGNHEMYHGGQFYFEDLLTEFNQPNPFFCLRNDHWCILGLDTGYQSIMGGPSNTDLRFEDKLYYWLADVVKLGEDKRGVMMLTHHQYITAFKNESNFLNPAWQIQSYLGQNQEIIWIWGHEHRFSIYGKYKYQGKPGVSYAAAYGRCIGNGGMPAELTHTHDVIPAEAEEYNLVAYDAKEVDKLPAFPFLKVPIAANGYAVIDLNGAELVVSYYLSYTNDEAVDPVEQLVVRETWMADNTNGKITCIKTEDLTIVDGVSALTYRDGATIDMMGTQPPQA